MEDSINQFNEWNMKNLMDEVVRLQKLYTQQDATNQIEIQYIQKDILSVSDDLLEIKSFAQKTGLLIEKTEEQVGFRFVFD